MTGSWELLSTAARTTGLDEGDTSQEQQHCSAASILVGPCAHVAPEGGEVEIAVSVQVADSTDRVPADVCCVVDVSGSMGSTATYEAENGTVQDDGLTVLDIVKHAVKTVLMALQDGDRLALVAFNHSANTALELTEMSEQGKQEALEALEGLRPSGQTNIWGGILAAMEALRSGSQSPAKPDARACRVQAVLLLTDGQPNVVPPRGHLPELRDYMDSHPGFSFQLNTFGFGYGLNSELLLDLATEGNGTFAFIPDAVIVGTTFVNSVANVLSTHSQSSTISLMPRNGAELVGPVAGAFHELEESWGRAVSLGPLQCGQARHLVLKMRLPAYAGKPYLDVVLAYPAPSGGRGRAAAEGTSRTCSRDAVAARCLADTVGSGYEAIGLGVKSKGREAGELVAALCERVQAAEAQQAADGRLIALKADIEGRMSKALKGKERFNRWGKHYLRALVRSHQLQVCTNFIDPGLQPYGGALFRELRQKGDSIFLSLPPPKPSMQSRPSTVSNAGVPTRVPNMTTYYAGAGGGCFAPSSCVRRVRSRDHGTDEDVPIEEVLAGDLLRAADGGAARVRCLVRIDRHAAKGLISLPCGLRITPRHPVRQGGRWQLPHDLPGARPVPNEDGHVYNLVLDRCHVLPVDGMECATWGHGLHGDIIGHQYFGTQRVLESLAACEGWQAGFVHVRGTFRDEDGDVVGFLGGGAAGVPCGEALQHNEGTPRLDRTAAGDTISNHDDACQGRANVVAVDDGIYSKSSSC